MSYNDDGAENGSNILRSRSMYAGIGVKLIFGGGL